MSESTPTAIEKLDAEALVGLLEEFDDAAQAWGCVTDEAVFDEYERAKDALIDAHLRLTAHIAAEGARREAAVAEERALWSSIIRSSERGDVYLGKTAASTRDEAPTRGRS